MGIKSGLEVITHKLYAGKYYIHTTVSGYTRYTPVSGDVIPVPGTRNSMEQLSVAEEKLAKVIDDRIR